MALKFTTNYLEDSLSLFRYYKKLGEGAMAQVSDEQLLAVLDPEMNSIAQIVKHVAGNMRSRWTDFLTSDGEKPDRYPRSADENVGSGLELPILRTGAVGPRGCGAKNHHPGRSPFGDAGGEPSDCPLRLPRRADRVSSQALAACRMEIAQHSAQPVCQI